MSEKNTPRPSADGIGARGIRLSAEPLQNTLALLNVEATDLDIRIQRALWKANFNGYVTLAMADEIACDVLKMHPFEIWGQEYEDKAWFDMDDDDVTAEDAIEIPLAVAA